MGRKAKLKRRRTTNTAATPRLLFTFAHVRMLKNALRLVDQAFERNTYPMPNRDFGIETLRELQAKIDDMLQSEDWDHETPFDYNELHLLYGAIHMYLVDLTFDKNVELMPTCLQLCKQLSRAVEGLPLQLPKVSTGN